MAARIALRSPPGVAQMGRLSDPEEREVEVFAQLGKGGDLANSDLEAICRMVSLWLRAGGSIEHVIRQLSGIGSSLQVHTKEGKIMSLGDGLARALRKYVRAKNHRGLRALVLGETGPTDQNEQQSDLSKTNGNGNGRANGHGQGTLASIEIEERAETVPNRMDGLDIQWQQTQYKVICPDCQCPLRFGEGCVTCENCGFSKC